MLEKFIKLISAFVSGTITADDFERQYLHLRQLYLDSQTLPAELRQSEMALQKNFRAGFITSDDFESQFRALGERIWSRLEIHPFSEQARLIDELFMDVDAYCGDPALRDEHDLDADQLREAAGRALDELIALEKEQHRP